MRIVALPVDLSRVGLEGGGRIYKISDSSNLRVQAGIYSYLVLLFLFLETCPEDVSPPL